MTAPAKTSAVESHSVVKRLAERFGIESGKMVETLKNTVFHQGWDSRSKKPNPPLSNEELAVACLICDKYELDPFVKEIYVTRSRGKLLPIVGVDGWIKVMNSRPDFDGIEFSFEDDSHGNLVSCTVTIYVKGRSRPVVVTEYLDECYRDTEPWNQTKRRMLRHKALIQGCRVAFGISGIHDEEDAERIIEGGAATYSTPAPVLVHSDAQPEVHTVDVPAEEEEPRTERAEKKPSGKKKTKTPPAEKKEEEPAAEPLDPNESERQEAYVTWKRRRSMLNQAELELVLESVGVEKLDENSGLDALNAAIDAAQAVLE